MDEPSQSDLPPGEVSLFAATLSPYRSLSLRGFNILMAIAAIVSFALGTLFLLMGAWPVFGFFGLDVLILHLAFRRNYLDANEYEHFDLTAARLVVRRVSAAGKEREYSFNPYWTRLVIDRRGESVSGLSLASSRQRLTIGAFLAPSERASFADALSKALALARGQSAAAP